MNHRPDWKAYEDGTLPLEQREAISAALRADERLRRDYQAYQEYVRVLRAGVMAEPVPVFELRPAARPAVRRPFVLAGAAAFAAASIFFYTQRPEPIQSASGPPFTIAPELARIATRDAQEAADWVGTRTHLNAPVITLKDHAMLVAAAHGSDWGGYAFVCKEGRILLRFALRDQFSRCGVITEQGLSFYDSDGLGWRQGGISFHLSGDTGVPLRQYAAVIHRQLSRTLPATVKGAQNAH
jgi:hypothetical protein